MTAGAFSFGFLVSAVLSPSLGRLMDRRGPRVVMEIGVCAGGRRPAAGAVREPLPVAPLRHARRARRRRQRLPVLTGQSLYLPNWFVRRRGLAISLAFSGVGVGLDRPVPVGAGAHRARRLAYGLLGAGPRWCWCAGAAQPLLVRHRPARPRPLAGRRRGPARRGGRRPATNVVDAAWVAVDWTLGRAMRTAPVLVDRVGYLFGLFAWYAVQVHQTKYLVEIGFSPTHAAWALGFVSLAGIPGISASAISRTGSDASGYGRSAASASRFATWRCSLLREAPTPALLYVMVVSQGLLGYGLTSVVGAIPAEIFQGRHYGAILGTLMLAAIGGGAAGPWVTGALYDTTGSYTLGVVDRHRLLRAVGHRHLAGGAAPRPCCRWATSAWSPSVGSSPMTATPSPPCRAANPAGSRGPCGTPGAMRL